MGKLPIQWEHSMLLNNSTTIDIVGTKTSVPTRVLHNELISQGKSQESVVRVATHASSLSFMLCTCFVEATENKYPLFEIGLEIKKKLKNNN